MNVRPTLKVSKTSLVFKVEQTRGGSQGRVDDKEKKNNNDDNYNNSEDKQKENNGNDKNNPRL